MLESLKYVALPVVSFPEAAQKALDPNGPAPLKMMAAKGLLPLKPDQTLKVWFQLSLSGDDSLNKTINESVASFDENTLLELAQSQIEPQLLDWLVKKSKKPAITEAIILNQATADATIMDLAATAPRDLTELIANNHVRLLRAPDIIEKLYLNPATRMATIDRILALAKENKIELTGLKALQDAINSDAFNNDEPGMSDEEFEAVLAQAALDSEKEADDIKKADDNLKVPRPSENNEEQELSPEEHKRHLSHQQIIDKMNAPQRVRLALMGTREDRNILLRDSRRIVYMSVLQSTKMSVGEVSQIASKKGMSDDIIGYIAKRRDWIRNYPIMVSLVNNPKCPLGEALSFLKVLRVSDLKLLMRSKSISSTLARQATALYRQKQS